VTDLLRQDQSPTAGNSGLLRILRNRFPTWAATAEGTAGGLLGWLLGRPRSAESIEPFLDQFAQTCAIDYGMQKVLPRLADAGLTTLAHAWLRGDQLGESDLARLGLPRQSPTEHEQETNAREVVLSLFRLAGNKTTLFVCFDEVEALQAGAGD